MSKPFYDLSVIEQTQHHRTMSDLVDLLCHRTGNANRDFFQAEVAYFLGLIPSSMRATINSPERGVVPINIYSIGLATSGFGKGHSVSVMEEVLSEFRDTFMGHTFETVAEDSLFHMAQQISGAKGSDEAAELEALQKDFNRQGFAPFIFDSGTGPAVKQLRYKLLLSRIGSINFQMDELGSNLMANNEVLNVLLELYDLGKVKAKLVKNTPDNERGLDIVGSTPANMLMFGTSSKLFDGAKTEDEFFSFLATGYARRCFFGVGTPTEAGSQVDPKDLYRALVSKQQSAALEVYKQNFKKFADPQYFMQELQIKDDVGIELLSYRLESERLAAMLPDHEEIRKAELSHRYFKAMKLAGVYAFLDESPDITIPHLRQAIKVAEESGASFGNVLKRERNFVRLANYIASSQDNLTHADLVEDLPFYPTSTTARREMMDLAMAWGVSNHVVITKNVVQSVEFFSGSTLQETSLDEMHFSFSDNFAYGYDSFVKPFDALPKLLAADGMHWCNHGFEGGHRHDDKVLEGFNMLVVDVDGGVKLDAVHELLADYVFITSTTKRHTEEENRFRLIMPMNYHLQLSKEDYKEFMDSFLLWLPFESDPGANQRSKKWMTNPDTEIKYNLGPTIIDVLPFIPKTKANNEYVQQVADLGNLDNLERWFLQNMDVGSRNNNLLNYAMMLKDGGMAFSEVEKKVLDLNERSGTPLKKDEVQTTVLKSVASKYV